MASGMSIYDSSGAQIFTVDDRLFRIYASFSFTSAAANESFSVPGMTPDTSWIVLCTEETKQSEILTDSFTLWYVRGSASAAAGIAYVFRA